MDFRAEGASSQQGVLDDLAGGKIDAKEAAARLKAMMKQGGA